MNGTDLTLRTGEHVANNGNIVNGIDELALDGDDDAQGDTLGKKNKVEKFHAKDYHSDSNLRRSMNESTKRKMQNDIAVQKTIQEIAETGSNILEISRRDLELLPDTILSFEQLQYLYADGNSIKQLPDDFFKCFPNLQWLDLRNNQLIGLPSIYVGRHKHLKNLLLEGNQIRTLPLELGMIPTITGINIRNNPLEFPPPDVIDLGTKAILQFMQEMLQAKSQGKLIKTGSKFQSRNMSDDDEDEIFGRGSSPQYTEKRFESDDRRYISNENSDLIGPVPSSAALHRPPSYSELKNQHQEKLRQAGASGVVEIRKSSGLSNDGRHGSGGKRSNKKKELISPVLDKVEQRYAEEIKLNKQRQEQIRIDDILQKQRDRLALSDWRDDGRKKQMEKYREAYLYGGAKDSVDVTKEAPFAVYDRHLKMPTNEERIKMDVKETHEKIRRAMSPRTVRMMELAREQKDFELREKINEHTRQMQERRRQRGSSTDALNEMEIAKRELEVAKSLFHQVEARRKELEYRFTAYVGDAL